MADVIDVAEYVLNKVGEMTAMKLQKLVYYCQAWHLAWTEHTLFNEKIEAWRNGPVIPALFERHKGHFKLQPCFFHQDNSKADSLSAEEKNIIDRVLDYYGSKDPHWLSQLTHMETPWKIARAHSGHSHEDRSLEEITPHSIFEYYSTL